MFFVLNDVPGISRNIQDIIGLRLEILEIALDISRNGSEFGDYQD